MGNTITYGRSVKTIGDQLFGDDDSISDKEKISRAQEIYDAVLNAFPNLRTFMFQSQANATKYGYVETILGRRRHIPDMQLPEFDFKPMKGYVNPDIDPLDPSTLENKDDIPERIVNQLKQEYSQYRYKGQIWKRNKQLSEKHIKVINNRSKITDASRECVNCVDTETEILTFDGWKKYNEVKEGDRILSYSLESGKLEEDIVEQVHLYQNYDEGFDVVNFNSLTFSALCTTKHKWVVSDNDYQNHELVYTQDVDGPILKMADYNLEDNPSFTDDIQLEKLGTALRLDNMKESSYWWDIIDPTFIYSLSTRQATIVFKHMIKTTNNIEVESDLIKCYSSKVNDSTKIRDFVQSLATVSGYSTRIEPNIDIDSQKYNIYIYLNTHEHISKEQLSYSKLSTVWCVTTNNHTWVARRNGYTYITGNSRIQGSAAELTKMAIIKLINDPRWLEIGGRLLIPIHDELQCEVPVRYKNEAAKILAEDMSDAGNFLPFTISCDVEVCRVWYGLEYPCPFEKPKSLDDITEEGIKWVQYHLFQCEYLLPVYKDENGEKPRGMAAKGVNGVDSPEMQDAIQDYIKKHNIDRSQFIDHIGQLVEYGINF